MRKTAPAPILPAAKAILMKFFPGRPSAADERFPFNLPNAVAEPKSQLIVKQHRFACESDGSNESTQESGDLVRTIHVVQHHKIGNGRRRSGQSD